MRRLAAVAAALLLAVASAPPALAIEPPAIDPGAVPPDDTGPDQAMEQRKICSAPTVLPNSNFADKPWAADYLHLAEAQKFATGAGVTVAVIDTGVNASPRVPAEPGGDFVDKGGNGLSDCDAHGTLTASIIAGRPAPTDAFIGVAPEARILSLRQTSEAFMPKDSRSDPNDPNTTQTAGSLRSLARAIVHAANLGAQVTLSSVTILVRHLTGGRPMAKLLRESRHLTCTGGPTPPPQRFPTTRIEPTSGSDHRSAPIRHRHGPVGRRRHTPKGLGGQAIRRYSANVRRTAGRTAGNGIGPGHPAIATDVVDTGRASASWHLRRANRGEKARIR